MSKLRLIAIVAVVALLIRLIYFVQLFNEWPMLLETAAGTDDHSYHLLAQQLAAGGWFTGATGPWLYAPLYPHLLGALYALTGTSGVLTGVVVNALSGIGASVVVALLGLRLFGRRAGLLGGLLMALSGSQIFYEGLLLNDGISTLLLMSALWFVVDAYDAIKEGGSYPALKGAAAGALFGLGALARPSNLLVAGVLGIALIAVCARGRNWKPLPALGVAALLLLLVMAPFVIRNGLLYGTWMTNTGGPVTTYMGNAPGASGHLEYTAGFNEVKRTVKEDGDWLAALRKEIAAQPLELPKVLGRKTLLFFNAWDIPDNLNYHFMREYLSSLRFLTIDPLWLFVLGFAGLILTAREWRRLWPLYLFGAAFALSIILVLVAGRYKLPFLGLLALFGGAALSRVTLAGIKEKWHLIPAVALVLILLSAAFWPRPSEPYRTIGFPLRDGEFTRLAPQLYELGQTDRSILLLLQGEAALPDKRANLAAPLAEIYLDENRPADALAQSQPILTKFAAELPLPQRASLMESQARALFRLGRNAEGCAWARELKKIRPDARVPADVCGGDGG